MKQLRIATFYHQQTTFQYPGVAQLAERGIWDAEAVRAGLTTRTSYLFGSYIGELPSG